MSPRTIEVGNGIRVSAETLEKLRAELKRLEKSENPKVRKLLEVLHVRYPEVME